MSLPVHTFGKFDHSFLSKGIEFPAFFQNLFYHPSLLSQSMLLGGGGCCMPNFSFIILHCSVSHTTRKNYSTLIHAFGRGLVLYIYIFLLSRNSSIILHCSINPCFWEGVDVAFQTFLLSSCIALSFRTTREKTTLPLFTSSIGD